MQVEIFRYKDIIQHEFWPKSSVHIFVILLLLIMVGRRLKSEDRGEREQRARTKGLFLEEVKSDGVLIFSPWGVSL